eukprot:757758-Hanusia_phi.AAC.6
MSQLEIQGRGEMGRSLDERQVGAKAGSKAWSEVQVQVQDADAAKQLFRVVMRGSEGSGTVSRVSKKRIEHALPLYLIGNEGDEQGLLGTRGDEWGCGKKRAGGRWGMRATKWSEGDEGIRKVAGKMPVKSCAKCVRGRRSRGKGGRGSRQRV